MTDPPRRFRDPDDVFVTRRILQVALGFVVLFSIVSGRLFYIQIVKPDKWALQLDKNRREEVELPAARGPIMDTRNRLLAADEMVQSVIFDNIFLDEKKSTGALDRMAQALSKVEKRPWPDIRSAWSPTELRDRYVHWVTHLLSPALDRTPEELIQAIYERKTKAGRLLAPEEGESVLAKGINAIQSGQLHRLLDEHPLSCLRIDSSFRRVYPHDRPLTHIVGLINSNGPVCGVEYARQKETLGTPGSRTYERDVRGREVAAFPAEVVPPKQGNSLRLTLDAVLQDIVEESVDETGSDPNEIYAPALDAKRLIVLLLDAKTMAIRAIVCRKKEEQTDTKGNAHSLNTPSGPLLVNPAVEEVYEPGSTMKIVTLAAALDSGKLTPNTMIPTNWGYYDDEDVEPIRDDEGHGELSVTNILVHSSNIGAYKLARTVGLRRFYDYIRGFGFGDLTGVECRRESKGILHAYKDWNFNVLSRCAYGYNIAVTPLQMCAALGVIVNDGNYQKPYLVEATLDDRNRVVRDYQPEEARRVISPRAAKFTREAMSDVVERGTGTKAQSADYWIAGKTGTARKAKSEEKGYEDGKYVVSFLGYAPSDNPKLLGVVIIDTPHDEAKNLYGGKLAAPLFRRIMERSLRYYAVPAQEVAHLDKASRQ